MTQRNPSASEAAPINTAEPLYGQASIAVRDQLREHADLATAVRVAQRMLAAYGTVDNGDIFAYAQAHGGVTEALRILLRALGVQPSAEQDAVRRSVDRAFPLVAQFLAAERGEGQ